MTRFLILFFIILCSCGNERTVQLPEVETSNIHEVLDVSPIYIFYDETQPDSTLFNRKNMISTTNWLVNVDKRLSLKQVVPHLQYLQDKRNKDSMHKNEDAKNYFTCNDTGIGNLGFLEFTDVSYNFKGRAVDNSIQHNYLLVFNKNKINITYSNSVIETDINNFLNELKNIELSENMLHLFFKESLSFQDYIEIKSKINNFNTDDLIIDKYEIIF
ncbi:hypothetical protein [Winogradskyella sp. 3972H.M.0a.05]|uniref:hypothetical protein n=1 Tax=Winogradskyella sp. 3972H.M.0a.05 TaxID=2950277 RepID=UPI003398A55B